MTGSKLIGAGDLPCKAMNGNKMYSNINNHRKLQFIILWGPPVREKLLIC